MSKFTRRRGAFVVGAVAVGALATSALPAFAGDQPTIKELMADCASGRGHCTFNDPVVHNAYLGDYHQVSNTLYNCSTSPAKQTMDWSDSVGTTDSAEVSFTAGGGLEGVLSASVTAKYGRSWSTEHKEGGGLEMTVQPGEVGWISRAQAMAELSGTWQTHYNHDDPHWGHWYWYWEDYIDSPVPNGTDGVSNAVIVKTRPMTAQEKAACGSHNGKVFTSATKVETPSASAPKGGKTSPPRAGDDGATAVNEEKKPK